MPPSVTLVNASQGHPLWLVVLVTVLFAALARALRAVSTSGAAAGGVVCVVLYAIAGPVAFVGLALVFLLTWGATRLGYQRKLRLGTAEKRQGRNATQVVANVGLAAICAVAYHFSQGNAAYLLGVCAVLAEAAADTVSSELGQALSQTARLITNGRRVAAGVDGGVSVAGTISGALAASLVGAAVGIGGLVDWHDVPLLVVAAMVGVICDSYLGATLQQRKFLSNSAVNFLSTLTAAIIAVLGWQALG